MVKINTRPGSHAGVCSLKIRVNDVIHALGNACCGSMMTVLPVCWHGEASEPCGQACFCSPSLSRQYLAMYLNTWLSLLLFRISCTAENEGCLLLCDVLILSCRMYERILKAILLMPKTELR